jgi:hypothetical protein
MYSMTEKKMNGLIGSAAEHWSHIKLKKENGHCLVYKNNM